MRRPLTRSPIRIAAGLLAVLAGALLPVIPATAASAGSSAADDFKIASFDADYELGRDAEGFSTLQVVETIDAVFPEYDQNHGIERAIPVRTGLVDTELAIVGVTDATGAALPYTTYDEEDFSSGDLFRVLRIGDADTYVHGEQSYVIEYTMRHVVAPFADTGVDEFYWDINGDGWMQSFDRVTARLHVASELRDSLTGATACYVGGYGDTTPCEVATTDDGFSVDVTGLGAFQTVTWAIAFESGTFQPGPTAADSWIVRLLPWILLGLVGACVLGVVLLRLLVFRNARGRGIVIAQYEGYPELGVMEAAELLGRGNKGLPAQFVQLVVTRAARLLDRGEGAGRDDRYRLELVDPSGLDRDDAIAVASVFGSTKPGDIVELDRGDRKLGDRLAGLTAKTATEVSRRYRARRKSVWTRVIRVVLFLAGLAQLFVWFWAVGNDAAAPWLLPVLGGAFLVGIVAFGFAGSPERLTREGALATEHLEGVRDYLALAEADRIRMLQSPEGAERTRIDPTDPDAVVKLHERLLPYAIIWGVEDRWQHELGTLYATTPTEIASSLGTTNFGAFATGYAAASFATTPPVATSSSSWSSSGGSSFSGGSGGGGFSGGGGGGGGGGGW